jgi:hypothetical protein
LRDEFLNGEIFYSLKVVQVVLAERSRVHYNTIRPHSLGYRSPAPEAWALETNLTGRGELGIATRFPTLHTHLAALQILQKLRYTNIPTGTKDWADQERRTKTVIEGTVIDADAPIPKRTASKRQHTISTICKY